MSTMFINWITGLDVSYDIELEESEKKTEDKKEKESDDSEDDMEAATGDDEEVNEETDKKRQEENRQNAVDDKKETDKDKDETRVNNHRLLWSVLIIVNVPLKRAVNQSAPQFQPNSPLPNIWENSASFRTFTIHQS